MLTVANLMAPIVTLALAIGVGVVFNFAPVKSQKLKPVSLAVFAGIVGIIGLVFVFLLSDVLNNYIYSYGFFQNFAALFQDVGIDIIKYNSSLVAAIVLLGVLEFGLASGFGGVFAVTNRKATKFSESSTDLSLGVKKVLPKTQAVTTMAIQSPNYEEVDAVEADPSLSRDERSMLELFVFGKVSQIVPTFDFTKAEGYFFSGISQLDWDTKHERKVLDALVRKNYLIAELVDKIVVCKSCNSAKIRIVKACPDCGSLRLRREGLIEHFSCGAVERQSAFEGSNGDLVCPKCKAKLQLIGSDYRSLPPAYKCLSCNVLNNEPKLTAKCGECDFVTDFDDESEVLLYKYIANAQMPMMELQNIKPIARCSEFFKSLGYSIVAPAYVSGKSGTQHLFDMLILGRVGWVELQKQGNSTSSRSDNGNTAVEVLVSSKPVNLGELTRIYGKINDIECDFILFAIPGLTANARNYAQAYGMKVSEGRDIDEALASSKIPTIRDEKT